MLRFKKDKSFDELVKLGYEQEDIYGELSYTKKRFQEMHDEPELKGLIAIEPKYRLVLIIKESWDVCPEDEVYKLVKNDLV